MLAWRMHTLDHVPDGNWRDNGSHGVSVLASGSRGRRAVVCRNSICHCDVAVHRINAGGSVVQCRPAPVFISQLSARSAVLAGCGGHLWCHVGYCGRVRCHHRCMDVYWSRHWGRIAGAAGGACKPPKGLQSEWQTLGELEGYERRLVTGRRVMITWVFVFLLSAQSAAITPSMRHQGLPGRRAKSAVARWT